MVTGRKSEWREEQFSLASGDVVPGAVDMDFVEWSRNKYEMDDGTRISVGLFPGMGEMYERGRVSASGWRSDNWLAFFYYSTIGQSALFTPTICSMFCWNLECDHSDLSVYGLVGCHRWPGPHRDQHCVETSGKEVQARAKNSPCACTNALVVGKAGDGTRIFFTYPGREKIFEEVHAFGKVDVMFEKDSFFATRRFMKAKHASDALTFRDIGMTEDSVTTKQVAYQRACLEMLDRVRHLRDLEGFPYVKDSVTNDLVKLEDDVLWQQSLPLPTTQDAFHELDERRMAIAGAIGEALKERERQVEESRILAKFAECRQKMDAHDYEAALAICEDETGARFDAIRVECNASIMELKRQAEERRILARLAECRQKMGAHDYEAALAICEDETGARFDAIRVECNASIMELKRQAEERRILARLSECRQKMDAHDYEAALAICEDETDLRMIEMKKDVATSLGQWLRRQLSDVADMLRNATNSVAVLSARRDWKGALGACESAKKAFEGMPCGARGDVMVSPLAHWRPADGDTNALRRELASAVSAALAVLKNEVCAIESARIADLQKMADGGDANAQYELGVYYMQGEGCAVDFRRSRKYLRQAFDNGHKDAWNKLQELMERQE